MSERKDLPVIVLRNTWRFALLALLVTLLSILALYRETAWSMVEIWSRSETFTHGFLVPPISLWLIWRRREQLAHLAPRPNVWAMLLFLGAGFFWLLGEIAAASVVSQFALTSLLVLSVLALLGLPIARLIVFPLAFLFFAVPFGEFAMPQLMEWTAHFTVLGLRLSGVPVFREGLHFVIPSGSWSVVEACSGVRYLIASLTVGTLFAYLNYRSLTRRLIFVGVAFLVPVIANWLRAYMIVMLGHLSGNKLATGVDHLIYGWVFFGIVIMIMFWIGARWREDELPELAATGAEANFSPNFNPDSAVLNPEDGGLPRKGSTISVPFAGLVVIIMAMVWPGALWQIGRHAKPSLTEIEALAPVPGWTASSEAFADWQPQFANESALLQAAYTSEGRKVGLYLGYYRNQGDDKKMVSSSNVLVSSGDRLWLKVDEDRRQILFDQQSVTARRAEIRSLNSVRLIVWQWYWINGHLTASPSKAKALTALTQLLGQGDDSAVIVVYAVTGDESQPDAALEAFVQAAGAQIGDALQRTREKR
ncbi:MAG: exosortase A [Propionivibrio sp.]